MYMNSAYCQLMAFGIQVPPLQGEVMRHTDNFMGRHKVHLNESKGPRRDQARAQEGINSKGNIISI